MWKRENHEKPFKTHLGKIVKGSKSSFENFQYQTCPFDHGEKDLPTTGKSKYRTLKTPQEFLFRIPEDKNYHNVPKPI